jgi:hypothetical protein
MGIALFFAAASNLRAGLKVDLVVPSTRTCVHLHPGCIGNPVAIFQAPEAFCFGHGNSYGAGTGLMVRCETAYCLGH